VLGKPAGGGLRPLSALPKGSGTEHKRHKKHKSLILPRFLVLFVPLVFLPLFIRQKLGILLRSP
jgi:hypothetical protein